MKTEYSDGYDAGYNDGFNHGLEYQKEETKSDLFDQLPIAVNVDILISKSSDALFESILSVQKRTIVELSALEYIEEQLNSDKKKIRRKSKRAMKRIDALQNADLLLIV